MLLATLTANMPMHRITTPATVPKERVHSIANETPHIIYVRVVYLVIVYRVWALFNLVVRVILFSHPITLGYKHLN